MTGRTCSQPADFHYCPTLDHLLYEAEYARKFDERTLDHKRSITSVRSRVPWTGSGYVRMHDGGTLEFAVKNIHQTGTYHVAVRYEAHDSASLRLSINRGDLKPPSRLSDQPHRTCSKVDNVDIVISLPGKWIPTIGINY